MAYKNPIGRYRWIPVLDKRTRHERDKDKSCSRRAEGDENVCHCGLRWNKNEDPPECIRKGLVA